MREVLLGGEGAGRLELTWRRLGQDRGTLPRSELYEAAGDSLRSCGAWTVGTDLETARAGPWYLDTQRLRESSDSDRARVSTRSNQAPCAKSAVAC